MLYILALIILTFQKNNLFFKIVNFNYYKSFI